MLSTMVESVLADETLILLSTGNVALGDVVCTISLPTKLSELCHSRIIARPFYVQRHKYLFHNLRVNKEIMRPDRGFLRCHNSSLLH